jgi:hypothetical protein
VVNPAILRPARAAATLRMHVVLPTPGAPVRRRMRALSLRADPPRTGGELSSAWAWPGPGELTARLFLVQHGDALPKEVDPPAAEWIAGSSVDVMLVGHLPFMAKLASRLIAGSEDSNALLFSPGSVACLERTEEKGWTLAWMIRPELLRE